MKKFAPLSNKTAYTLSTVLLLTVGINSFQSAKAQVNPDLLISNDGSAQIDQNGFDLFTGSLENDSNIPLPDGPVTNPQEGVAQPVIENRLAPNSINIQVDTDNIDQQLQQQLEQQVPSDFQVQEESLRFRSRFDVRQNVGNHDYGEGIEVNVYGPDGTLQSSEKVFIRGDRVQQFNGQTLPESDFIEVTYGPYDRVELRVLNLRPGENGEVTEHESAIYPTVNGELAVEDLQDGGDLDFNDGDYLEIANGTGETRVVNEQRVAVQGFNEETEVIETPFVEVRVVHSLESHSEITTEQFVEIEETQDYGEIENPRTDPNLLPHATGASTDEGEQLVYNQYSAATQLRLSNEGATVTGQTAPLNGDPAAAPTLVTGTATLNPFADENEAGLSVNVGVTQYLHSTHEEATDMLGNPIVNPDPDGPRLVQPTGLIHNTRIVGYVESTPDQVIPGEQLSSVNGVFDLPADKAVVIAPADASSVGRGDSAYIDNVGGLIIEWSDGTAEFVPQWNQDGYVTAPIRLEAGEARRVIYALVPQQSGQALQLDQSYELEAEGSLIADGGFQVISAMRHPENFTREMAEIYAVEDTLSGSNVATEEFNGIRGRYRERDGGELVYTVDNTNPEGADARVGNLLSTAEEVIPGEEGQLGYRSTTLAGGLYVRGSLTLGLGNQEDVTSITTSTYETDFETITDAIITEKFHTPGTQINTITTNQITETAQDIRQEGEVTFAVSTDGLVTDLGVELFEPEVTDEQFRVVDETINETTETVMGEEFLADRTVATNSTTLPGETRLVDRQVETETDTYPNVSPLIGEIAFGGILNFGNTPWTPAANTLRGEVFGRGVVIGQSEDGGEVGLRAEVVFHPFGEEQRDAYGYDAEGNLVPLFQTAPLLDDNGEQQFTLLEGGHGEMVRVALNQFIYDENGDRIPELVGTGRSLGPGVFVRLEEVLSDDEGPTLAGGLQFTF